MANEQEDIAAVKALIAQQFRSLSWKPGVAGAWDAFAGDFLEGAQLFASARPAKAQSVGAFVARMKELSETTLRELDERVLGTEIRVFGNIAVAIAACELTENGSERNRNVEMMLLVKSEDRWRIAAQAWDGEGEGRKIPAALGGA